MQDTRNSHGSALTNADVGHSHVGTRTADSACQAHGGEEPADKCTQPVHGQTVVAVAGEGLELVKYVEEMLHARQLAGLNGHYTQV
ncbi:hypothetical protein E2562_030321 [Oryza meyeriana var. granulata]|uniref:Uncharacterized protein n=1 Tax=Oryza meyeriana var. granulata TaxID=110450 RepID=A0A6G1EZT0_9ORYZ|nr:hypothetical protein E2562_030321 [Oryza meyeriana var. granulata]